jgi:hypothetical protein
MLLKCFQQILTNFEITQWHAQEMLISELVLGRLGAEFMNDD